jgi:hypothetical protein
MVKITFFVTLILIIIVIANSSVFGQSDPLFIENFENVDRWTFIDDPDARSGPSDWKIVNGELWQTSNIWSFDPPAEFIYHLGSHTVAGENSWTDYTVNAIMRSADNDGIGLIFRYQDPGNYYRILLMNDPNNAYQINNPIQRIQRFINGEPVTLHQNIVNDAYPNGYFSLSADVRGNEIIAYLNGKEIGRAVDDTFQSGKIGLMVYANTGARFDSVSVWQEKVIYDEPEQPELYPVVQDRLPYLQHIQETQAQISWRTVEKTTGTVLIGPQKGSPEASLSTGGLNNKHNVIVDGLEPNTRYFYSVIVNESMILEDASFVTAKPSSTNKLSYFVLGDSGTGRESQIKVRNALLNEYNRNAVDFLLHVGDVHQQAGDEYDSIYFDIYQPLLQELGFFLAIGNHDVITDNGGPFLDSFSPPGTNGHPDGRYYWHTWGNSFFINIDTNLDVRKGSPQYDFIIEALSSEEQKNADWTFAYFHHPPYTEYWPAWEGDQRVRDDLVPLFEEFEVDMVFNGHTHSYEHGIIDQVHYLIAGGGGGNLDPFGRNVPHVRFSTAEYHFLRVDIDGLKLEMKAIDSNGSVFDTVEINKELSVSLENDIILPSQFKLQQNYPNPFNPTTNITYQLPTASQIDLSVYNMIGQKISVIAQGLQEAGTHTVKFDASQLSSGIYLYRLNAGDRVQIKKMVLLK